MKYWLKNITDDSYEYPIFEVEIEKLEEYYCDFIIYQATSWGIDNNEIYEKNFIAKVHWKWDFCTHWWFNYIIQFVVLILSIVELTKGF